MISKERILNLVLVLMVVDAEIVIHEDKCESEIWVEE